jgi:predicted DNA binding protein
MLKSLIYFHRRVSVRLSVRPSRVHALDLVNPGRDELSTFRGHFESDFELRWKRRTAEPKHGEFGLTPEQRETLVTASELKYFAVPREATVEDVDPEKGLRLPVCPS